jgi:hypothetical protein
MQRTSTDCKNSHVSFAIKWPAKLGGPGVNPGVVRARLLDQQMDFLQLAAERDAPNSQPIHSSRFAK